jgi:hypothetical protein
MLQFNGGELVFQIRQTARPIEFEAAFCRAREFRRRRLRQKLNERRHLLLCRDRQGFVFGDQRVFAHNGCNLPTVGRGRNPANAGNGSGTMLPQTTIWQAMLIKFRVGHK